jgi:biopolymer transport protein ExbD
MLLPVSKLAVDEAKPTPVSIRVNANGQVWGDAGLIPPPRLLDWLAVQASRAKGSTLLVIMDTRAPMDVFTNISDAAKAGGFSDIQLAMQSGPTGAMAP